MTEPPLTADEQAHLDLHAPRITPLAECARPIGRPNLPHDRPVESVPTGDLL
ncbi:hypothetical protein [Streptomyces sp. NPDC048659]|uniref:hypothetical protein n=1 Tax=Streptomyces sp. NPDC048659 TaxID=3155489 RepID=UPI0034387EE9